MQAIKGEGEAEALVPELQPPAAIGALSLLPEGERRQGLNEDTRPQKDANT